MFEPAVGITNDKLEKEYEERKEDEERKIGEKVREMKDMKTKHTNALENLEAVSRRCAEAIVRLTSREEEVRFVK